MRYIICEDDGSGYYFWSLISRYVLKKEYKVVTPLEINRALGKEEYAVGISKIREYLNVLTKEADVNNHLYIVCIDNATDNPEISAVISQIHQIIGKRHNFHMVNYICFEQLLMTSPNIVSFFPNLEKLKIYSLLKQHAKVYGIGYSRELERLLKENKVAFSTTERIYNKIFEKVVLHQVMKIGRRNYNRLVHHYILKGKWSYCWTTDCGDDCPNNRCWEATGENNLMCDGCDSCLKNKSLSCVLVDNTVIRKYAEVTDCNKVLPSKLRRMAGHWDISPMVCHLHLFNFLANLLKPYNYF